MHLYFDETKHSIIYVHRLLAVGDHGLCAAGRDSAGGGARGVRQMRLDERHCAGGNAAVFGAYGGGAV